MAGLVLLGVIMAIFLLYLADRAVKVRARARQLSRMNRRLAAAAARSEEQQAERQAADAASAELTSVMPAINLRPPVTLPGHAERNDASGIDDGPASADRCLAGRADKGDAP